MKQTAVLRVSAEELKEVLKKRLRINRFDMAFTGDGASSKTAHLRPLKSVSYKLSAKDMPQLLTLEPVTYSKLPILAGDLPGILETPGKIKYNDNMIPDIDRTVDISNNFISPSKDKLLRKLARRHKKTYYSSTSSMTSTLMQFYLLLNNYHTTAASHAKRFDFDFTRLARTIPTGFIVTCDPTHGNDALCIESDKSGDLLCYLSEFGHIAEYHLTSDNERIALGLLIDRPMPANVYNISGYDQFLMRSQLDCHKLDTKRTFDIKSRAISDIRYDSGNVNLSTTKYPNKFNVAREFKDLRRTGALLKYSFQARIGQMHGIFIAFHNLDEFLAFEYLKLKNIDRILYLNHQLSGKIAHLHFKASLRIWGHLLDTIRQDLGTDNFRVLLKAEQLQNSPRTHLVVTAAPLELKQAKSLRNLNDDFNAQLSQEGADRTKVASDYMTAIREFNKSSSKNGVVEYSVQTSQFMGNEQLGLHDLPSSLKDWSLQYSITKENASGNYLRFANSIVGSITHNKPKPGEKAGDKVGEKLGEKPEEKVREKVGKKPRENSWRAEIKSWKEKVERR